MFGKSHQHEAVPPRKMPGRRLPHLVRGGQMNEAVLEVNGGAIELPAGHGIGPFARIEDLEEDSHGRGP